MSTARMLSEIADFEDRFIDLADSLPEGNTRAILEEQLEGARDCLSQLEIQARRDDVDKDDVPSYAIELELDEFEMYTLLSASDDFEAFAYECDSYTDWLAMVVLKRELLLQTDSLHYIDGVEEEEFDDPAFQ